MQSLVGKSQLEKQPNKTRYTWEGIIKMYPKGTRRNVVGCIRLTRTDRDSWRALSTSLINIRGHF